MEFTEDQLQALHRAGYTEEDVLRDVREVTALVEELNGLFSDLDGSNVQAKFERVAEISDYMDNLDEKYLDPAASKILEDAYEDSTGVHPEDIDVSQVEADIEAFTDRYENDPDFEAEIDAGLGDYLDEFTERMAASDKRGDELDARREQLEQNYEIEQTDNAVDLVHEGVGKDCAVEECTGAEIDLQELQELFDRVLVVDRLDIPSEEKIQAYEDFLGKYDEVVMAYASNENDEDGVPPEQRLEMVRREIDTIIGIPPAVLPNYGAEYHALLGEKIKALIDEAENNDDLTGNERSQIYAEAAMLLTDNEFTLFKVDQDRLENLSGASFEYLSERAEFFYEDSVPEETEDLELQDAEQEDHAAVIDQGIPPAGAGIAAVSTASTMKV